MKQDAPQVLWVPQEVFWNWFDEARVLIDYDEWCAFQATEEELPKQVGTMPPNKDVGGEDDPPGPVSRWYGRLGAIAILFDFHQSHSMNSSAVLRHGQQQHAHAAVREYFKSWGRGWEESPPQSTL